MAKSLKPFTETFNLGESAAHHQTYKVLRSEKLSWEYEHVLHRK